MICKNDILTCVVIKDFGETYLCFDRESGDRVTDTNSCFTQLVRLFSNNQLTKTLPYLLIEVSVKWWGDRMRADIFRRDEREVSQWKVRFLVVVYKSLNMWNSTNHPGFRRNSFLERQNSIFVPYSDWIVFGMLVNSTFYYGRIYFSLNACLLKNQYVCNPVLICSIHLL